MCVTVSQNGCPPIERCYDFYVDCFEGPGDDRTAEEKAEGTTMGNSFMISNPSAESIWMSTPFEQGTARLYSMQGSLLKTFALRGEDRLDVSELVTGQYILAIQTQNISVSKLVLIQNQH
jgi:hypothetical protein